MDLIVRKLKGGRLNFFIIFVLSSMLITGMFFVFNFVNANNPVCGNGDLESGEACDDGNLACGDGCSDSCQIEGLVLCGNSLLDAGEQCDAGSENGAVCQADYGGSCSYCSNVCQTIDVAGPYCGDGVANGTEECDDGNTTDNDGCSANCTDEESNLTEIPITTCQGSGELFLYQGDPFQPIDTSFTVNRDQVLIFTKAAASISAEVNSVPVALTTVFDQTLPFHVKVYSINTSPGAVVSITGTSPAGARYVGGYIAQDAASPVFDVNLLQIIYNDTGASTMHLNPGAYSFLVFDKYSENAPGDGPDTRTLNVNVAGSDGVIFDQTYTQPSPSPVEGAVVGNFNIAETGSYTMIVDSEDSVYWPVAQCEVTCEGADYEFELNPEMWVTGNGCYTPIKIQDSTSINVPADGSYDVKGVVERGNPGQSQTNESFSLNINGEDGPISTDDAYAGAITVRLDDLGNFNFNSGANNVYMNTASQCPPDVHANSVSLTKLCLYRVNKCGNNHIDQGEQCDDGAENGQICAPGYGRSCSYCSSVCQTIELTGPYCGDGVANGTEECDDGNDVNGDGCSQQCLIDLGGIKICKYEDADGVLLTVNDQSVVSLWPFTVNSIISSSTLATTTSAITGSDGCAVINNLPVGDYEIIEGAKDGWFAVSPASGKATTTVSAKKESLKNFYNTRYGIISGYKYKDNDGLASTTSDRGPLSGWIINLFFSISTSTPIATTTTNDQGYYEFKNLFPGNYLLTENIIDGWIQLEAPTSTIFILSGDSNENNNFINRVASYCGDGIKQSPNERGVNEECDASDGVGNGQRCTLQCKLETIVVPAINGGGGGGGGSVFIPSKPIVLGVEGKPLLTIEKSVNLEFANPGDKAMYSVKITNSGNLTAFGVTLKDVLPEGLVFSADNKKEKNISLGDIKAGETKIIEYEVLVNKAVKAGFYPNTAKAKALNHGEIIGSVDLEVREVKVLGEELPPTGFNDKEFLLLIGILLAIISIIIYSNNKTKAKCL